MLENLLYPVISVGGLALVFGIILGISAKTFAVKTDPKVEKIIDVLPGANCGGCGFPGCAVFAARVVSEEANYKGCPPAGAAGAAEIADLMGISATAYDKKSAYVRCSGTDNDTKRNYFYDGPRSCVAASQLAAGGNKTCTYSCLGLASCENVCHFDAIKMINGVAIIDRDKCTACGKCVPVCPKKLIEIIPDRYRVRVMCDSRDKGKAVRDNCRAGCMTCNICQKVCEVGAITIIDGIAVIDHEKCKLCMVCVGKCPAKVIRNVPFDGIHYDARKAQAASAAPVATDSE